MMLRKRKEPEEVWHSYEYASLKEQRSLKRIIIFYVVIALPVISMIFCQPPQGDGTPFATRLLGILILVGIAVLGTYFWLRKNHGWRFSNQVSEILDSFLQNNGLIAYRQGKDREGNSVREVTYSPIIRWCDSAQKRLFLVKFQLDGSLMSTKFVDTEFGKRLGNALKLEYISMREEGGSIVYSYSAHKDGRLSVSDDGDYAVCCPSEDKIRITENLTWDFRKVPHALISGGTGSGKTFFLTYLMGAFNYIGANIRIIDPKHSDISGFAPFIGSESKVVSSPNNIAKLLRETDEAMTKRYEKMRVRPDAGFGKDYADYGYKPVVMFFDELSACMASADRKVAQEINGYLMSIIMKGRQAGFFMILTMQRPDAEYLKGAVRDNLGMRVALGSMSADGYQMVFGAAGRDLQLSNYQKGDGFIYLDGVTDVPRQFSAPFLSGNVEKLFGVKG